MSVKYSLNKLKVRPADADCNEMKYYAKSQADGHLGIEKICNKLSRAGTVIRGDVLAVTDGLIFEMIEGLSDGKIVQLGDFGNFQIQVGSHGTETEKEFTAANIHKARIQFRPGPMLRTMLRTLTYERVDTKFSTRSTEEGNEGNGNDNGGSGILG